MWLIMYCAVADVPRPSTLLRAPWPSVWHIADHGQCEQLGPAYALSSVRICDSSRMASGPWVPVAARNAMHNIVAQSLPTQPQEPPFGM